MDRNITIDVLSDHGFKKEPDLDDICDHVANGGTLAKYCDDNDLNFGKVSFWIKEDGLRNQKYKDALACRKEWSVQRLCGMVMEMASFDPASVFTKSGEMKPISDWPPAARAALSQFESVGSVPTKVKFVDRLKSLEVLGRAMGMFEKTEKETSRDKSFAELVRASMEIEDDGSAEE